MKNPYDKQIGGSHYQKFKIQPSKFVIENELLYPEGCVIKYILRHRLKGKKEDLKKAIENEDGKKLEKIFIKTKKIRKEIIKAGQDVNKPDFGR